MNRRLTRLTIAILGLAVTACGGASEDAVTPNEAASSEASTATTISAPTETTASAPVQNTEDGATNDVGTDDGCDKVLTSDEVESILGTPVEFNGSGEICTVYYASDAIGNLQAFTGSKADQAMDTLLTKFLADSTASANGVLLDDDRGFVLDNSAIVRGDSGRVFRFDVPDGIGVPDMQGAMLAIAQLLLTR